MRQPNSLISQLASGGVMAWAKALPDRVRPSASPRPPSKALATPAVHTVDLVASAATA